MMFSAAFVLDLWNHPDSGGSAVVCEVQGALIACKSL
jgi:hypothetical protein